MVLREGCDEQWFQFIQDEVISEVWLAFISLLFLQGCAVLHHVAIGDIDDTHGTGEKIEVKISETGVDLEEAGRLADRLLKSKEGSNAMGWITMFQMGPKTGKPVFNEYYAEPTFALLREECPSGKITALNSIREMRNYPVVSGEIVKVTGRCLK